MNASMAARIADSHTSLVHAAAPKLNTETHAEIRVVIRRSQADIEREIMQHERRKLIARR